MLYFRVHLGLPLYDRETKIWRELTQSPDITSVALLLYFSAITASVSYLAARYSVLKNFGEVEAGFLHAVLALSLALGMALYPAINLYLAPIINRNVENPVKFHQAVQYQRKIAFIFSLGALPILMFPRLMLTIMFSEKFADSSPLVFLFMMSQFIVQVGAVFQALLVGVDDVKSYTAITSTGQIISALMCLLLVPYYGIKGVAFAFLIGNSFNFLSNLIRLTAKHRFSVPSDIYLLLSFTFSALFLLGLICSQIPEWAIAGIMARIGFLFLFGGGLFLFLNKDEKTYLCVLRVKIFAGKIN
jgi:O-antigen/teichoic acid export membrane protein